MGQWFSASLVATVIMMAAGQMITSDIMSMPLLWIMPLGAYLIGYMTAFADKEPFILRTAVKAPHAAVIILAAITAAAGGTTGIIIAILAILCIFMLTHRLIRDAYEKRPAASQLGTFYLVLAAGGVAGGIIVATIAPAILDWRWELPFALVAAAMMLKPVRKEDVEYRRVEKGIRAFSIAAGILGIALQLLGAPIQLVAGIAVIMIGGALTTTKTQKMFVSWIAFLMISTGLTSRIVGTVEGNAYRSYYGTINITENKIDDQKFRTMVHGSTIHGMQSLSNPKQLGSYYSQGSGVVDMMTMIAAQKEGEVSASIIGLGAGTMACILPGRYDIEFIEVDPEVVNIAKERFTYLDECAPEAKIIVGDGRKELEKLAGLRDVVVYDAFSSDAIPLHMLTKESLDMAMTKLAQNGTLMVHVSNRFLDIAAPVTAWAQERGYDVHLKSNKPSEENSNPQDTPSDWMSITRKNVWPEAMPNGWQIPAETRTQPWTDDRSSILNILKISEEN